MINIIKKFISSLLIPTQVISPTTTDLKGKIVVITGGTKGIGHAVTETLLKEGATVATLSRSGSDEKNIFSLKADITDEVDVKNAVSRVITKYGHIDVLINNAGQFLDKPIDEITSEDYEKVMGTNVKGAFLVTKEVVSQMKIQKSGLIIHIGSKISHNTNIAPNKTLYAASKYAIEGFSLALRNELRDFGIRSTCLMLGTVNTFVSFKSKKYLSPYNVGFVIAMIIKSEQVDFESVIIKSVDQQI